MEILLLLGTQIYSHATTYYKSLFGPGEGNAFDLDDSIWSSMDKVSELENQVLIKPFEEDEIKNALFQMEKNKAAGPDGIPIEFYQSC